jgi:peptide chain release factor subunit 3
MHIHTLIEEVTIKDIVSCTQINKSGEKVAKFNPIFAISYSKIICRISTKNPIAIEKFETFAKLGSIVLRDEGKTIAVGRVLRYKSSINFTEID